MAADTLLEVRDLKVHFGVGGGLLRHAQAHVKAVDGVSFAVQRGTTFGLVGESGSGKTTTALAVMRLVPRMSGSIRLGDADIGDARGEALRRERRRFQMVFQDTHDSLNPRRRVGDAVRDVLELMDEGPPKRWPARVAELFAAVGLRPEQQSLFPHQFSGGQRQRVALARALAAQPELLICDEPVSALDMASRAQILNLLQRLQRDLGLTYLFISHDLGGVRHLCDRVAVMYLGVIVEMADRDTLFSRPLHPFTVALWSAEPSLDPRRRSRGRRIRLQGDPPSPIDLPTGCRFAGRCPVAEAACSLAEPPLAEISPGHWVRCRRIAVVDGAPQPILHA